MFLVHLTTPTNKQRSFLVLTKEEHHFWHFPPIPLPSSDHFIWSFYYEQSLYSYVPFWSNNFIRIEHLLGTCLSDPRYQAKSQNPVVLWLWVKTLAQSNPQKNTKTTHSTGHTWAPRVILRFPLFSSPFSSISCAPRPHCCPTSYSGHPFPFPLSDSVSLPWSAYLPVFPALMTPHIAANTASMWS
jgi:hypothetical protein